MNRQIKSRVGVSGFLFALLVTLAGGAVAGITNSKHDLSVNSTGATIKAAAGGQTEICVFCHTPHGASTTANTPLWNHTASASASFGVYANTNSINATDITAVTGSDGTTSSLCMSCHDGSVAVNSQNNVSNNGLSNSITDVANRVASGMLTANNSANLGTGATALTNDHPINFTYDAALVSADGGLVAPGSITGAKLFGGKVQCASCHDVHDSTNGVFLRASMSGSSLCLKCHIK